MQMIQAVRDSFNLPDLRRKLLYTFLILAIYRLAAHIPVPGVNQTALRQLLGGGGPSATIIGLLDLLSGGAIANFSVLAMGVYPYITAQIIVQLLVPIIPYLENLSKEKEGRDKINQYVLYATIPLAALNALGQIRLLTASNANVLPNFGFSGANLLPTITMLVTMTAGTMFAIWLGQLVDEQGIGNGISLIIFSGIVARLPQNLMTAASDPDTTKRITALISFAVITIATIIVIVYVQQGERRIPVQYGKRMRGRKMYGGGTTHIPLRVNTAGMIPLIFAQSFLAFPAVIAQFLPGAAEYGSIAHTIMAMFGNAGRRGTWDDWTAWFYWVVYFLLVVGLTYFYTDVMMQQQKIGESLQKQGAMIPGKRPGPNGRLYEDYLNSVMRKITLVGALFLGLVAVLPFLVSPILPGATSFSFLSTGLLIVVGVVIDTMKQLQTQLLMRHYEVDLL
jgi:preprotein translocase subunit SecY